MPSKEQTLAGGHDISQECRHGPHAVQYVCSQIWFQAKKSTIFKNIVQKSVCAPQIVDLMAPVTSVSCSLLLPVRSTPCRIAWWAGSILCMTPATSVGRCELSLLDTVQLHSLRHLTFLNPFQLHFVDITALWYGTLRFLPVTWCLLQFKISPQMSVSSHSRLSKLWKSSL